MGEDSQKNPPSGNHKTSNQHFWEADGEETSCRELSCDHSPTQTPLWLFSVLVECLCSRSKVQAVLSPFFLLPKMGIRQGLECRETVKWLGLPSPSYPFLSCPGCCCLCWGRRLSAGLGEPGASTAWALRHGAVVQRPGSLPDTALASAHFSLVFLFSLFPRIEFRSLSRAVTLLHETLVENKEMTTSAAAQNLFNRDASLSVEHLWAILSQNQLTLKGKTGQWFSRLDTSNYTIGK